jgi:hypothetical protein
VELLLMSERDPGGAPERLSTKSTLSDLLRAEAERLLRPLCAVPPHAAHAVRVGVRFERNAVILFQEFPRFDDHSRWIEHAVAKFVYVKSARVWRLYCLLRDLKWHLYEPFPEAPDLASLVEQVRRDPTGIFWG